jgi:hypothetical protein
MAKEWDSIQLDPSVDPYISWSLGPGEPYFSAFSELPLLVPTILRLTGITAIELAQRFADPQPGTMVRIPLFYLQPPALLGELAHITAIVTADFFEFVARDDELRSKVSPLVLGPPLAPGTFGPDPEIEPLGTPRGAPEPGTVVVGVIDDGFAFGHERFRLNNGGTRVEYIWLQDGVSIGAGSSVDYGREYRKADQGAEKGIDTLLSDCTTAGILDEDKLYRLTGVVDFTRDGHKTAAQRRAHGTHVMDLACGDDPSKDRRDRPIVCVQLPWRSTADTSGSRLDPFVLDGIRYILDRADRIAIQRGCGPLPVVINFSYGIIAGPHDGTSALEAAIDEIVATRKQGSTSAALEVVLPSGNSHLTRAHAQMSFPNTNDVVNMRWRVLPDDRTSSFLEIWLPPRTGAARMVLTVTPPGGQTSPPLGELVDGEGFVWQPHGQPLCWVIYQFAPAPSPRGRFFVALLPTEFLDVPGELAPPGWWTIRLRNVSPGAVDPVHAWIQRDDTPLGYPVRGRQSYFDESCYVRFDAQGREIEEDAHHAQAALPCHVKRAGLINAIATGAETIVAGGYLRKELRFARYSAGGTPDPAFRRPDAALVSDDSKVHAGVLAAGSRSGSRVAINGTSVAAPQLARWVADQLAAGNPGDRAAVCAKAQLDEGVLPVWKPAFQPERGGCGRMLRDSAFPRERFWDWR